MVFDGETQESPRLEESHRGHDPDDRGEKQKMSRRISEDPRHRDQETKEWTDRHRHSDRGRGGYIGDEMSRDSKSRSSGGSKRDGDYFEEKRDREKYKRRDVDDIDRDELVCRKRTLDYDSHAERRDDGDYRKRNKDSSSHVESGDGREYRKRGEENNSSRGRSNASHREWRDDRDYRKRNAESDRRETMDEASERKRNANGDSYYKGRREEREDGRRNTLGERRR
jgi:peptidyl-prolyl cis-trans isomerase-like 4